MERLHAPSLFAALAPCAVTCVRVRVHSAVNFTRNYSGSARTSRCTVTFAECSDSEGCLRPLSNGDSESDPAPAQTPAQGADTPGPVPVPGVSVLD
jgi:hypothetical protein